MATIPTGPFWDVKTNPKKPTCEFDKNAVLDIPYNWTDWLDEIGQTIDPGVGGFLLDPTVPMKVVQAAVVSGAKIVLARIAVDLLVYDPVLHLKKVWPVRCHIKATDGQEEDQTLWFKIVEH